MSRQHLDQILIVSDNTIQVKRLQKILRVGLQDDACVFYHATRIEDVLQLITDMRPDIILLSPALPDGSGVQCLLQLSDHHLDLHGIGLLFFDNHLTEIVDRGHQFSFDFLPLLDISDEDLCGAVIAAWKRHEIREQLSDFYNQYADFSYHDYLTDLPNRYSVNRLILQALSRAKRYHYQTAMLLIGIDNLKLLNDKYGTERGDAAVKNFAERLSGGIRENDSLARSGGADFIVILDHLGNAYEAGMIAMRLHKTCSAPIKLSDEFFEPVVSIGIVCYPGESQTSIPFTWLRDADIALFRKRKVAGGGMEYFSPRLQSEFSVYGELTAKIEQADFSELSVTLSPVEHSLKSKRIFRGTADFSAYNAMQLPMERFDYIFSTTKFAYAALSVYVSLAIKQCVSTDKDAHLILPLNQAQFFHPQLFHFIEAICGQTGYAQSALCLEINAETWFSNAQKQLDILTECTGREITICLRSFGRGEAAIKLLQDLPISIICLDTVFTDDIVSNTASERMVKLLVEMAHQLGIKVLASNVTEAEQYAKLTTCGCDYFEGKYT